MTWLEALHAANDAALVYGARSKVFRRADGSWDYDAADEVDPELTGNPNMAPDAGWDTNHNSDAYRPGLSPAEVGHGY